MNEKQKLTVVRPNEIAVMRTQDDWAHPYVEIQTDGTGRADADELRLWRATRQSEGNQAKAAPSDAAREAPTPRGSLPNSLGTFTSKAEDA